MLLDENTRNQVSFPLYVAAGLMIIAGLAHVPVFLLSGGDWEGPLSLRKPILFGISTGMTVWSMAWVLPRLRRFSGDSLIAWTFSLAMLVEVGLITLQTWRGVASHFNHSTDFDTGVEQGMFLMISFATLVIVYLAIRSMIYLDAEDDIRLSINAGFIFLIVSCLIGFVISSYGNRQALIGENPSQYGEAGVTKFPHGVAIHAIQIFPTICWILWRSGVGVIWRKRLVWLLIAGMTAILLLAIAQTLRGKARFDTSKHSLISITVSRSLHDISIVGDRLLVYSPSNLR